MSGTHALEDWDRHTQSFLSTQNWHPGASTLLLAVSGGGDSVAMLHWARRAASRSGATLVAAHVNHGLRPSAAADQAFVAALCLEMGIACRARELDPGTRPARESVEMWARRERYAFFAEAAAACGAGWILTAHHRDDLVETVFQRLGRGTGARGLRGIPFRRGNIVRPFLNRGRAEILAYLRLCGALWREDESNADVRIDRNWYRHRYLPRLRRSEPDLDARVFSLAMGVQALGKGIDALEAEEGLLLRDGAGRPYLSGPGIAAKLAGDDPESLDFWARALIRASRADLGLPASARPLPITKEILLELRRQWQTAPGRVQVPLSAAIALKSGNGGIYCVKATASVPGRGQAKKDCSGEIRRVILDEGSGAMSWRWGSRGYSLAARRYPRPGNLEFPAPGEERAIFDAALFSCTLQIRTRQDGDRFSPLGLQSRSRKLKTFFNEEKVPIGTRENLPLILSDATIAWVPGHGISDFFKVSGSTSHILELVLKCENL